MKQNLLVFLSKLGHPANVAIASTLGWLCKSAGYLFDNYYDTYHQGVHFPGGDSRTLQLGELTGGTVSGDRHFEEFCFLLSNFRTYVVCTGESILLSRIMNLNIPVVVNTDDISVVYKKMFSHLNVPLPARIVMIGSQFEKELSGLEAYLYPEIYYRQAIGVPQTIPEDQLDALYQLGSEIFCVGVNKTVTSQLSKKGYQIKIVDQITPQDDYYTVTSRLARRWKDHLKGWILGDPVLVFHWLPKAVEDDLVALYSIPQGRIISGLRNLISSKGKVVYGRQCSDHDFFELSKLDQCFQVIDPCRPPFQSVRHIDYCWHIQQREKGFFEPEYSDAELRQFAKENRILISLMFWSGMVREITNFYNLMDLFATAKLRCGLVLTAQSYEYGMHSALELLTIPLERGGVFPIVEPVLGSCGIGVGIESCIRNDRLKENLEDGLSRIIKKVENESFVPRGWWPTMDTDLKLLSWWRSPKSIRLLRYPPYFQLRYETKKWELSEEAILPRANSSGFVKRKAIDTLRNFVQGAGLTKYVGRYRPYDLYAPGPVREDIVQTTKAVGLKYMFTKSGFDSNPEVKYIDDEFIALNYTAGQWDGWTPFETINHVSDLSKAERCLQKKNKPGWIVSTIDSCLWSFTGEFWKRGTALFEIAQFCVKGGKSKQLINVKPYTIARYARIIAENTKMVI